MRQFKEVHDITEEQRKTKSRILLCAVRLFAIRGYDHVSMKELADELGIQPGAIYNHYPSKEHILNCILERSIEQLDVYYELLEMTNQQAGSFEEIIRNMFAELLNVTTEFTYYGITIAQCTQFVSDKSRTLFYEKFVLKNCEVVKRQLELAIRKGFVKPFPAEGLATMISSSVISMNSIQVGKFHGNYEAFDTEQWYQKQMDFILSFVK